MTTLYTNRDNTARWQIEIDGEPPAPGEITRVVISIGGHVLDTETDGAITLDATGIVTLNLNGQLIEPGRYQTHLTAWTNTGQRLAVGRPAVIVKEWVPD